MIFFYLSHKQAITWLTALSITVMVLALSDVNKDCIARNNGTTPNDYLLGTWYKIYEFHHLGPYPTCECGNVTFTKPTQEELKQYREKFRSTDLPHEIGDDAVVVDKGYVKGLVLGSSEAKTYIIDPHSVLVSNEEGYEVYVLKRINDKYMLFWQCCLRGFVKWLLTRDRNATDAEIQQIIWDTPDITYKDSGVRYCNAVCYGTRPGTMARRIPRTVNIIDGTR